MSQALRGAPTGKKRGRKPKSKVAVAKGAKVAAGSKASFDVANLKAAGDFIRQSGSAENAIESIRAFQKLAVLFQ